MLNQLKILFHMQPTGDKYGTSNVHYITCNQRQELGYTSVSAVNVLFVVGCLNSYRYVHTTVLCTIIIIHGEWVEKYSDTFISCSVVEPLVGELRMFEKLLGPEGLVTRPPCPSPFLPISNHLIGTWTILSGSFLSGLGSLCSISQIRQHTSNFLHSALFWHHNPPTFCDLDFNYSSSSIHLPHPLHSPPSVLDTLSLQVIDHLSALSF